MHGSQIAIRITRDSVTANVRELIIINGHVFADQLYQAMNWIDDKTVAEELYQNQVLNTNEHFYWVTSPNSITLFRPCTVAVSLRIGPGKNIFRKTSDAIRDCSVRASYPKQIGESSMKLSSNCCA